MATLTKDQVNNLRADNLRPHQYKPGQSGNPSGRPKGSSLTARLRKLLEQDDGKLAETLAKVAVREAAKGKYQHLKEVWDRVDGTLVTKIQIDAELEHMLTVAEQVLEPEQYAKLVVALAEGSSSATS
jgi:hypothetical protein